MALTTLFGPFHVQLSFSGPGLAPGETSLSWWHTFVINGKPLSDIHYTVTVTANPGTALPAPPASSPHGVQTLTVQEVRVQNIPVPDGVGGTRAEPIIVVNVLNSGFNPIISYDLMISFVTSG